MRKIWSSSSQHEVSASYRRHVHYLNDVARIASTFFYPTPQDMLLSCSDFPPAMTNAFRVDGIDFEIYNVFGQKSKRRKWINSFSDVDAIVFVAALSDYDETNATTGANRMSEALALFRSICCSPMFRDTSTILLLNKKDIFAEKILTSDIADQPAFSDYNGPDQDFASGTSYFIRKFKKCLPRLARNSTFVHVTSHTDPGTVDFVADSTRTIIMTENLRRSGFLGPG